MTNSRDIMRALLREGWVVVRISGDHHQLKHPTKSGLVTLPHPKKDLPMGTVRSIYRQAGLKS